MQAERKRLAGIIGKARDRERQRWWVLGAAGLAFLCGLGVAAPLFREIPWGGDLRIASFIVGGDDGWDSGRTMMRVTRPDVWNHLLWEDRVVQNNYEKIKGYQDEENKSKTTEGCIVGVKPD
ncbi:hypothetical protein HLH44_17705 [Gluconacetobacter sp. 1c LMG 22058]|uniref:Uncharacterized protein n=1 Tax=Gluconacetobacter dulcium TaxID=2729096 RepID=A0A7W4K2T5_9PROT|nr:DUF6118 family protein [Gluconacetobacter dulcium]MBB2199248.1 hypothetical protein [Gluconacetobacter dulcium]